MVSGLEWTNIISSKYVMVIERNGMECWDPILELLIDLADKISENGRNIYKEINSIKQYSKLISIEHFGMKYAYWHFEDLEYLYTINIQYSEILSNVTTRRLLKLFPSELMDVRFGRSIFIHFELFHYYFALSTSMRNHYIFHKVQIHRV